MLALSPVVSRYSGNRASLRAAVSSYHVRKRGLMAVVVFTASFQCLGLQAQSDTRSICVAPKAAETPQRCAPGLCAGGELSLRIDRQSVQHWPKSGSMRISGLSTTARHRIVIYRAGKAEQSFSFRFSEFKSNIPCLFLNDLYWTAELWEAKRAPWCKCR